MGFVLVYIWTMFCTSVIALYDGNNCQNGIYVCGWLKVILILPVKKETKIPVYIIVVHGMIQLLTILCFTLLAFHTDRNYVFRIYGIFLSYGCTLCVLILRKLYEKKYNTSYGSSVEHSYCLKYHINDSRCVKVIYKQSIDEYEMAILWDEEYLSYCLSKISKKKEIQYRLISVFRLKKRMLYFEKKVVEGESLKKEEPGIDSSAKYYANKLIKEFYESNRIFTEKSFPYIGVSCNPDIDKLKIDEKDVNVLEEKKEGEWTFYVWEVKLRK